MKVVLVYRDLEGRISEESIWVQPVGINYKIDNIPFYAPNLALNDVISVENDEGILYFDELIEASGHATIQLIFFQGKESGKVLEHLEKMGCTWEGMKDQPYFAINVPPTIDYKGVKDFLDDKLKSKVLDYKEACLPLV